MVVSHPGELKWLKPWLGLPFFKNRCTNPKHIKCYTTMYCTNCMEQPMCKLCWKKNSSQHPNHQVLKVCTASWRTAIDVTKISKCLDVSHIQEYRINGEQVVYLNPYKKEKEEENSINPSCTDLCQVCKRRLNDSKNTFCSIACKVSSMEIMELDLATVEKSEKMESTVKKMKKSDESCSLSFRKRNRKGIPFKAPST